MKTEMEDVVLNQRYYFDSSVFIAHKSVDTANKTATLTISGFASMGGVDRHGDDLDPSMFDIPRFMANPQLWWEHSRWMKNGNPSNVGLVKSMHTVRVDRTTPEDVTPAQYNLVDIAKDGNNAIVSSVTDDGSFLIKNGDRGLWVTAEVMEDDVINLIMQKRVNAFSWSGLIYRKPTGKAFKIDVMEVSLVLIPANARALFRVGKAYLQGHEEQDAQDANGHVQGLPGVLSGIEKRLNDLINMFSKSGNETEDTTDTEQEGGDSMKPEDIKSILDEALKPVADAQTALVARLDAIESNSATEEAETETQETTVVPDTQVEAPADNAADEAAKTAEFLEALKGTVSDALKPVQTGMDALAKRIDTLEKTPAKSKAADDSDDGTSPGNTLDAEAIGKALAALPEAKQKSLRVAMLAHSIVPDSVMNGHRG